MSMRKLLNIINEGITFDVVKLVDIDGQKFWSGVTPELGEYKRLKCWLCKGTGLDYHPNTPCPICKGEKTTNEWVSNGPKLNVSNTNGFVIQEIMGIPRDKQSYSGIIEHDKLPELIRSLMYIKNKSIDKYTEQPSVTGGKMGKYTDSETNLPRIGKSTTMIDSGRSLEQVETYIDRLLEMAKFAQKNNAAIGWG